MKLYTQVEVKPPDKKINYGNRLMFIGSCFSDNISKKLSGLKFRVCANPAGTVYNPASILNCIKLLAQNRQFNKDDLFLHNGFWHSFGHHGQFSSADAGKAIEMINLRLAEGREYLKNISFLFVTLGTANVFIHNKSGKIVSNCHKLPQREFTSRMLGVDEITSCLNEIISISRKINPEITFVFSISPVRHLGQGAFLNQLSKATLFLALNQILENRKDAYYFPAYEIFTDELRDYRYYAEDMVHPSETGIEYIWEKFKAAFLDDTAHTVINEVNKIIAAVKHKPFNKDSTEHKKFAEKNISLIAGLTDKYKFLDFGEEMEYFKRFQ